MMPVIKWVNFVGSIEKLENLPTIVFSIMVSSLTKKYSTSVHLITLRVSIRRGSFP